MLAVSTGISDTFILQYRLLTIGDMVGRRRTCWRIGRPATPGLCQEAGCLRAELKLDARRGQRDNPAPLLKKEGRWGLESCSRRTSTTNLHMVETLINDLTEKRRKVAKALAIVEHEFVDRTRYEDGEFARSQANAAFRENDLTEVLDETDEEGKQTLETTTDLLNKIQEEDGYFRKTQQGGESAFVIDTEAVEEDGDTVTGATASELREIASQVLQRYGIDADLSDIDFTDWREVIQTVNRLVGHRVLMVKSEPNLYRFTDEARKIVHDDL